MTQLFVIGFLLTLCHTEATTATPLNATGVSQQQQTANEAVIQTTLEKVGINMTAMQSVKVENLILVNGTDSQETESPQKNAKTTTTSETSPNLISFTNQTNMSNLTTESPQDKFRREYEQLVQTLSPDNDNQSELIWFPELITPLNTLILSKQPTCSSGYKWFHNKCRQLYNFSSKVSNIA